MKKLLLATTFFSLSASQAFAELTEERVNELIGEFLRDNPKVIIESLQSFQLQEEANKIKAQQTAVKDVAPEFMKKGQHYPEAGNPKGDVTIIEFFDYNCPACKMMFESIDSLLQEDTNVRVIFVEYPIFGPQSDRNAELSLALNALEPEKYFAFHQAIMRHKGKVDENFLLNTAMGLGIDRAKLKKEADKPIYDEYIKKDRERAAKLQVTGTPAAVIGSKFVGGALNLQQLKNHVRWARQESD